jgi:DNA topoisomerase-1
MDSNLGNWWRREGSPRRFRYTGTNGRRLTAHATIRRIERLAIPPAWTDVHIAPSPDRKIQAWGRDAAGRKQYLYSEDHVRRRDRRKWRRVPRVARLLPNVRERTNADLRRRELDRSKVLATVVRLICRAGFRAGSERYAVDNRTFGICTLAKRHVAVDGANLVFTYKGKRRLDQRQVVADTPLVEIIEQLMELPGRRLFQYIAEDGTRRPVTATAVNQYLREICGERITSKDLRTLGGTLRAATILADIGPPASGREAAATIRLTCKLVAADLGNTPAICRSAYIHPAVLEEYGRGRTIDQPVRRRSNGGPPIRAEEPIGHYPEERALMAFLARYG